MVGMDYQLELSQQLEMLPLQPGVYLMRDKNDMILYIGKARNLARRVSSYFQNRPLHGPKIEVMVPLVRRVETIITDTEVEALVLEEQLIRKHQPRYNTLLKNSKGFPYIRIDWREDYPKVELVRQRRSNDQAIHYGPYPSAGAVRGLLHAIGEMFPIEKCKDPKKEKQVCIYYQIKKCMGHCQKKATPDEFKDMLGDIRLFLEGKSDVLKQRLTEKMKLCSQRMQYEQAAQLRDTLQALQRYILPAQKQKIVGKPEWNLDVVQFSRNALMCHVVVFQVRGGLLQTPLPQTFTVQLRDENSEILTRFLFQYYSRYGDIPPEILLPFDLSGRDGLSVAAIGAPIAFKDRPAKEAITDDDEEDLDGSDDDEAGFDVEFIPDAELDTEGELDPASDATAHMGADTPEGAADSEWDGEMATELTAIGTQGEIVLPAEAESEPEEFVESSGGEDEILLEQWLSGQRGTKVQIRVPQRGPKKALLEMAAKNAASGLAQAEKARRFEISIEGLEELQTLLEMEKMPERIEGFDISHFQGQETVASMVVFEGGMPCKSDYRRFKIQSAEGMPNDFLSMEEVVSRRYKRSKEGVIALPDLILIDGGKGQVSAALKAFAKLHLKPPALIGLAKKEELIVIPDRKELVRLPRHSPALRLLQQVRDESHRFALTFQRQRRAKRTLDSELDAISGIGPRRRQDLLRRFGSVDKIRSAELSDLMLTGGLPRKVAQQVFDYFRKR